MSVERRGNVTDRGKRIAGKKTFPSATLSTISLTWTGLGLNPGLSGERQAT
jgi:hypothetical protein